MANRQRGCAAEERRLADEETCWERKHAATDLAAVGAQQFRAESPPHLRLFYL